MRSVTDRASWERAILSLGRSHLLQSWDWGALKSRWGWRPDRFLWIASEPPDGDGSTLRSISSAVGSASAGATDGRLPRAMAQVLTRRLGRSPFRMAYLPKGPLLADIESVEDWSRLLLDLEAWARRQRLTFVKIDADVPEALAPIASAWRALGWRPSEEQIQFPNTMLSSLEGGEEAVLAGMKSKTRYNIRLAGRRGVTVRRGGLEDLPAFLALYRQTGRRSGFGLRADAYYRDLVALYLERDACCVILAEKEGRPLAGVVPVAHGDTCWYLYGASADEGREDMPAYLAQWESLRWAIDRGCTRYDWWGGPRQLDPSDPLWGIYRFKAGFGAELVRQQGAWDLPVSRPGYAIYRRLADLRAARIRAKLARTETASPR